MQDYFRDIAAVLDGLLAGGEVYTSTFRSESSDFVRFNRASIRQAGSVVQHELSLEWIRGRRVASGHLTLAGDLALDRPRLAELVGDLRARCNDAPDDPHLLYSTEPSESAHVRPDALPSGTAAAEDVLAAARGRDLVGILASGSQCTGFASSLGHRNWHQSASLNFDWSVHGGADRAVKGSLAGFEWRPADLEARFERADGELAALARPARSLEPGRYRVYLAPAAVHELMEILCWGGFGLRAHRTKTTPLLRLASGDAQLAEGVSLWENTAEGIAPDFQSQGFRKPDRVALIEAGRYRDCLVSPRSAVEYDTDTNGAEKSEAPQSLDMLAGALPRDQVLAELGTGLYVSNLWYMNYSDRSACRTTGMTRFATFWVENGEIAGPIQAMRFDETVYRMLGENWVGSTRDRDWILDPDTYGHRSTRSARLPGVLVDDFTFTL
ncbi:MAG: metallopeptidase TldD-related protein [Proteobacteria bacterium]|nr:metallopeptidase TldD-related protein [Pseudomonadota bacterium]